MGALVTVMVSPHPDDGYDVTKEAAATLIADGWTAPEASAKTLGAYSIG